MNNKVDLITLGCSKNLVDSERLMRQLQHAGYTVTHDAEEPRGEIAIINTCGFIGDAKEESINMILQQGQRKATGQLKQLFVMGCLSQRYLEELKAELPEVDGWYGKFDYKGILTRLGHAWDNALTPGRTITTPSHYAYIKISEGCNRHCAYCAIPIITGQHKSRPMEDILDEVRQLVAQGVHEFQVIAQELTYYGLDIYHRRALAELIDKMADIEGVKWIRLHYAYPTDFPMDVLDVMRRRDNVCRYLDIALQHIADPVLSTMHRHITKAETVQLLQRIREAVPDIHIRTTLMVGHPGEDEAAFQELLDFTRQARFERMGAFAYSEEEGTYSATHYSDDIPDEVKQTRLSKLMRLQQRISEEVQAEKVGQTMTVVVDRKEGDYWVGRTEFDSPEVDPEVLILTTDAPDIQVGQFIQATITGNDDFDLYARLYTSNE
ncbi:MAG: 30S ribosomal protein S12 methylthiotransferase RimO [Bacteroidaceae bacterium]|nr:30S ribosomal protein S12 methylthiotransferase RimO [Bacteroidaceae bacterium]